MPAVGLRDGAMTANSTAGYSVTPLVRKLGLKSGLVAVAVDAPRNYMALISDAPEDIAWKVRLTGAADFIHVFVRGEDRLSKLLPKAKNVLKKTGMLWVSWPKKSSGVPTDLSENVIRSIGLAHGLVDVKVCAIDETWSGLKFVYRVKDR